MLSVCHSVEWTDPHTTDEALHPHRRHAATTDFRRGVSNALDDGGHGQRRPRGRLYRGVFAEKEKLVMMGFGERTARALRDMVRRMRRKWISLERWA